MNLDTASRLVTATKEVFPSSKNDIDSTIDVWMGLFSGKDNGLMETAIRSCWLGCKFFPTPADITEAIKDLMYVEQTKPKQLAWDVKRTDSLHKKIMDMATGKTSTKEYLASVDITKLAEYARVFFPAISNELVLKNYPELSSGLESQNMCHYCRTSKQACNNVMVKHELLPNGYIKNLYQVCEKVDRRA